MISPKTCHHRLQRNVFFNYSYETIGSSCSRHLILGTTLLSGVKLRRNGLADAKIQSDVLNLPEQCFNLLIDMCVPQNRFTSDFSAFSKKGSHLQIALISKRFEAQQWDWSQMIELSKAFLNLTNFFYLLSLEVCLLAIIGERRLIS